MASSTGIVITRRDQIITSPVDKLAYTKFEDENVLYDYASEYRGSAASAAINPATNDIADDDSDHHEDCEEVQASEHPRVERWLGRMSTRISKKISRWSRRNSSNLDQERRRSSNAQSKVASIARSLSMHSTKIGQRMYSTMKSISRITAENDMPGWDSQFGNSFIKWIFLRLPIPLLLVLFAIALPASAAYAYLDSPPKFDISLASFTVPNHEQALLADAIYAAKNNCSGTTCVDYFCTNETVSVQRRRRSWWDSGDQSLDDQNRHRKRRESTYLRIALVFKGKQGNALCPACIQDIKNIERTLVLHASYRDITTSINSLTGYFYPPDGNYDEEGILLNTTNITNALDYASGTVDRSGYPDALGDLLFEYGSSFTKIDGIYSSEYIRGEINSYEKPSDSVLKGWIDILESASTDNIEVIFASPDIFNYQILQMVYGDIYYVIYALIFVAAYMLFHTASLFLTIIGIFNICMSFPLGYSIYREVFGHQNLSILAAVTMFVVIGIGVDDIFVFVDMFRQPNRNVKLLERMVFTMSTAARATLFTTLTSATAFAANTLSEIPALADFGLLTALVITANYFLLILVVPPVLGFWWRYIAPFEICIANAIKWVCLLPIKPLLSKLGSTNSSRDSKDLDMAKSENGTYDAKKPALGYNNSPESDYELETGTWKKLFCGSKNDESEALKRVKAANQHHAMHGKHKEPESAQASIFSWILYNILGNLAVRGRWPVLISYVVFVIVAIQQAALLKPATKPPALVPEESNLGKVAALQSVFSDWDSTGGSISEAVTVEGETPTNPAGEITTTDPTLTQSPTATIAPSLIPTSSSPTLRPTTLSPTLQPTARPTDSPAILTTNPTTSPSTSNPTLSPSTASPTAAPTTSVPSLAPTTAVPTVSPSAGVTDSPVTPNPTLSPSTSEPTTSTPTAAPSESTTIPPTSEPTSAPSVTMAPSMSTTTMQVTIPSNEGAANVEVKFVFGLLHPYVDRSNADETQFTEDRKSYIPIFDPKFNRASEDSNSSNTTYVPLGLSLLESQFATELMEFCDDLVNDTSLFYAGQDCSSLSIERYGEQYMDCTDEDAGNIYLWFHFDLKALFTKTTGSSIVIEYYKGMKDKLDAAKSASLTLASVQVSSSTIESAIYEQLAIDGSIWGIIVSLLLCFAAVVLFKAHAVITGIIMTVILSNVATVVAIFHWYGWTLGGIEAVSLSILVGTSVDYAIHMTEGFLEANPDHREGLQGQSLQDLLKVETDAQLRWWRVRQAISSVGVPICSSAITTAGSAVFLTMTQIQLFKRFGEIIVINTVVSIVLTLTLLPAILAHIGPLAFKGSFRRSGLAAVFLAAFGGFIMLILYIMASNGSRTRGPSGEYVF